MSAHQPQGCAGRPRTETGTGLLTAVRAGLSTSTWSWVHWVHAGNTGMLPSLGYWVNAAGICDRICCHSSIGVAAVARHRPGFRRHSVVQGWQPSLLAGVGGDRQGRVVYECGCPVGAPAVLVPGPRRSLWACPWWQWCQTVCGRSWCCLLARLCPRAFPRSSSTQISGPGRYHQLLLGRLRPQAQQGRPGCPESPAASASPVGARAWSS